VSYELRTRYGESRLVYVVRKVEKEDTGGAFHRYHIILCLEMPVDTLVNCPCGHTLALHDGGGCAGERLRPCPCPRDRVAALDAAVGVVRTQPVNPLYPMPAGLTSTNAVPRDAA
jgi:hypothetical protein